MDILIIFINILAVFASICNCYDNNDDPSIINEYFNSESFDDESTSDYTTSSIFISSISTTKPEQESKSFGHHH
ncbi:hypothetical protein DERF_006073 [Dermatophagoides farinae]|uniref:Uncharacterized protein n=1 Tax=Dermatophagoides farinae TaxID=6954 RepID=A0A922L9C2_DERFA|nr:hypothetical protein DERF_006073 [Dermatophagoides farinae]